MLRSTLVVCMLLVTADGFTVMMPASHPSKPSSQPIKPADVQLSNPQRQRTFSPWPRFAGISKEPQKSGSKVREMATFLASQLLEKALKEVAKEDGKTKMSLEDIQKLAESLQPPPTETKEFAKTSETAEEAVEGLLAEEPADSLEDPNISAPTAVTRSEKEEDGATAVEAIKPELDELHELLPKSTEPEATDENIDNEDATQILTSQDLGDESSTEASEEPHIESILEQEDERTLSSEEEIQVPENVSPRAEAKPLFGVARFPDVISKDFGRPLDVLESAVPPLRESSLPKRTVPDAFLDSTTATATLDEPATEAQPVEEAATVDASRSVDVLTTQTENEAADNLESSAVTADAPGEEEIIASEEEGNSEADANDESKALNDLSIERDEETNDTSEFSSNVVEAPSEEETSSSQAGSDAAPEVEEEPEASGESLPESDDSEEEMSTSQANEEDDSGSDVEPKAGEEPEISDGESTSEIGDVTLEFTPVVESEVEEPSAPDSQPDESSDAESESPVRPSSDIDVEESSDEEPTTAEIAAEPETSDSVPTISEIPASTSTPKGKFLQPIRNFFSSGRNKNILTENSSDDVPINTGVPVALKIRAELIAKARQQPKSPEEEAGIASKYESMTLEDRSFAILNDLGMVGGSEDALDDGEEETVDFTSATDESSSSSSSSSPAKPTESPSVVEPHDTEDSSSEASSAEATSALVQESAEEVATSDKGKFLGSFLTQVFPSGSRAKSILKARQQPKSLKEEAELAAKYGKMPLKDRAFAILYDLGMIEMNPHPNDRDYDHSKDDEYCV